MTETAILANGCFWCTEAIFKRLKGVVSVIPGYAGGKIENPTYQQVCSGTTGHAEAIQIEFDPNIISFDKILNVFFATHDPTTLNKQGNDIGTQYRSVIFYQSEKQKKAAEEKIAALTKERAYSDTIVTEVTQFTNFYPAENYHKDYFSNNQNAPYCTFVINPKIKKLLKEYSADVKDEYL